MPRARCVSVVIGCARRKHSARGRAAPHLALSVLLLLAAPATAAAEAVAAEAFAPKPVTCAAAKGHSVIYMREGNQLHEGGVLAT